MDHPTSVAVQFERVTKSYRLYDSPQEMLLDQLGLNRLMFWRRARPIREFVALRGIDLTVRRGERLGIVGRNGAGKTTLLKMITSNFRPTHGRVSVHGSVQALMATGLGFHQELSGIENVRSALKFSQLPDEDYEKALQDVIDFVELDEHLYQPLKTYSSGMRARLQFAAATAIKPDILIVDEVLGAGDAYFSAKSALRMKRLANSGSTLIVVSHSMSQILAFCDRAIWLERGSIIRDGAVRDVVSEYEVFIRQRTERRLSESATTPAVNTTKPANAPIRSTGQLDAAPIRTQFAFKLGPESERAAISEGESEALKCTLADGQQVYRWPSERGIKLDALAIYSDGRAVTKFREFADIEFRASIRCEITAYISCQYQISVLTLDGRRVTRISSPTDRFESEVSQTREVRLTLAPCRLGKGHYYINFAILSADSQDNVVGRYDLVSRFCDFEVYNDLDTREAPLFFHDGSWRFDLGPRVIEGAGAHDNERN